MELEMGLDLFEEEVQSNEFSIIPKKGIFLGLDISEHSSGVCLCENGRRYGYNFSSKLPEICDFREVSLRRELKGFLRGIILGKPFDVIIVEDAFQGINPNTTRTLYALNTAIDEMILDGEIACNEFHRLDNGFWKSCLFSLDEEGLYKGMSDKVRIEKCLAMLGVHEEGAGFQDRLDSLGMLVGYFLQKDRVLQREVNKSKKKVVFGDICYNYQGDLETIIEMDVDTERLRAIDKVFFPNRRITKKRILECLTDNPNAMMITEEGTRLGSLCSELGLTVLPEGGCFAVWVKSSKLNKYIGGGC